MSTPARASAKPGRMRTRELGRSGIHLSEVSLGTWGFAGAYGPLADDVQRAIVEEALTAGITTFDAAPLWGDGAVERLLGEALAGHDDVQRITRGGARFEDDRVVKGFGTDALRADLEGSLERLAVDRVDVWLLHDPPEHVLREDALHDALATFAQEGLFRVWGVSTTDADVGRMAIARGAKALCVPHNLFARDLVAELATELEVAGCGLLARSPLLHGLLAGRWTEYRQFGEEDHRRERWSTRTLGIRVRQTNTLRFLVRGEVSTMAAAALRYVLAEDAVTTCLVGARRPVQARDAARIVGEPPYLPEGDLERLTSVLASMGA